MAADLTSQLVQGGASAFFGALAGGLAAAIGAAGVARREVSRDYRIRLYDELLPPVRRRLVDNRSAFAHNDPAHAYQIPEQALETLRRAATIAGRRERSYVTDLERMTKTLARIRGEIGHLELEGTFDNNTGERFLTEAAQGINDRMRSHNERMIVKIDAFIERLSKKV